MSTETPPKMLVGLKVARAKKRITQRDLSEQTGFSVGYISRVEALRITPSWDFACKVAAALDTSLDDLVEVA